MKVTLVAGAAFQAAHFLEKKNNLGLTLGAQAVGLCKF